MKAAFSINLYQYNFHKRKDFSTMLLTTLCYIENADSYLMLHRIKKKADVNKDKWIGIGGKFEKGESPEDCLLREAREETGLTLTDYRLRGVLTFICDPWESECIFLYTAQAMKESSRTAPRERLNGSERTRSISSTSGKETRSFSNF